VVRVEEVTPPYFVDVLPLINQLDNEEEEIEQAVIYNVPYFTLQGGKNAVRITPQKGDIGIAVFAMRDISEAKKAKAPSAPATLREYSPADALYIGGILNATPERYIEIDDDKITVKTDGKVIIDAAGEITVESAEKLIITAQTEITGDVSATGDITVTGSISATGNISATGDITAGGISVMNHTHSYTDTSDAGTTTLTTTPPLPSE
jgi:hypothetical protein